MTEQEHIELFLENFKKKLYQSDKERRTDHLGNVFASKRVMCDHYGVSVGTYDYRRKAGYSVEQALTGIKYTERSNKNDTIHD